MLELARVLPLPGPAWGRYPLRPAHDAAPPWRRPHWRSGPSRCRRVARAAVAHAASWHALDAMQRAVELTALRSALRRRGLEPGTLALALGVVSACASETLGWTPRETQRLAAAALLDNRMAEMATGEGKTLAIGLAAAVAALASVPVHVVTANDYLAARDAGRLAPLFAALGLRAASLAGVGTDVAARRAVYAHHVVYTTAKDLAFDFLRDRQTMGAAHQLERVAAEVGGRPAPAPLMRGLCMALLDEADSILLDEAEVPLVLSRHADQPARRAFLWQAVALARQLDPGRDFVLHDADRTVTISPDGEARLVELSSGLGGPWLRPRYRREAITVALAGLHACRRDEHYLVRDGRIELLDEVTGRVATGRVWSRGLQTVVALKEGLAAPPETDTVTQITFQRFFQRYWRLCGISGTLWEARAELQSVYGARVVRIPLHRPCRRRDLASRSFADARSMFDAAVERVAGLHAAGRPVLVGTDSVADSQRLAHALQRRGIEHRVLDALHDGDEAAIVAGAGRAGCVTVATRMAGRGTDIELDERARAAGGLHVLSCQRNPSRRLDRQLAGRAGRQGDPGSAERWSFRDFSTPHDEGPVATLRRWNHWFAAVWHSWVQRREEARCAALRRTLLEQDLNWERRLSFAGPST